MWAQCMQARAPEGQAPRVRRVRMGQELSEARHARKQDAERRAGRVHGREPGNVRLVMDGGKNIVVREKNGTMVVSLAMY